MGNLQLHSCKMIQQIIIIKLWYWRENLKDATQEGIKNSSCVGTLGLTGKCYFLSDFGGKPGSTYLVEIQV